MTALEEGKVNQGTKKLRKITITLGHFLTNVYISNAKAKEGELIAVVATENKADIMTTW